MLFRKAEELHDPACQSKDNGAFLGMEVPGEQLR
jgi:hypothetical protein